MKKISRLLYENYPALVLIVLWFIYEFWLMRFSGLPVVEILNNTIKRSPSASTYFWTTEYKINYCIKKSIEYTLLLHIIPLFILLILKYIAKCYVCFNKRAFIVLSAATVISLALVFAFRLYGDLWWFNVIQTKIS
ncbi:MAG: hypothetical protein LKJ25_07765 [Clostridia bacterium]|jgi:hypothetical protein|nr:hypothetical protein [Clostridia bacterium]